MALEERADPQTSVQRILKLNATQSRTSAGDICQAAVNV